MSQYDDRHDDERLRARLRAADPASSLAPADPVRVARLQEAAMSGTDEKKKTPLTWLAAAAAVVAIGGVAVATGLGDDTEAGAPAAGGADRSAVLVLEAPGLQAGRCMVPNAGVLAAQDVAFLGTVRELGEGTVELAVDEPYAGVDAETVEVRAPSEELPALVGAVGFREGEQYLVSATDGRVTVCGFSGPVTAELQALYDEAFGG